MPLDPRWSWLWTRFCVSHDLCRFNSDWWTMVDFFFVCCFCLFCFILFYFMSLSLASVQSQYQISPKDIYLFLVYSHSGKWTHLSLGKVVLKIHKTHLWSHCRVLWGYTYVIDLPACAYWPPAGRDSAPRSPWLGGVWSIQVVGSFTTISSLEQQWWSVRPHWIGGSEVARGSCFSGDIPSPLHPW